MSTQRSTRYTTKQRQCQRLLRHSHPNRSIDVRCRFQSKPFGIVTGNVLLTRIILDESLFISLGQTVQRYFRTIVKEDIGLDDLFVDDFQLITHRTENEQTGREQC